MTTGRGVPLDDDQLLQFLVDGYLELQPSSMSATDHEHLYRRATDLYDLTRATASPTAHLDILGDNLRAAIPELDTLLTDPAVHGALTSVLGPDYLLHPHSFCHRSSDRDQIFHQDGNLPWNERGHVRSHRPDWAMLFYYPQDVDEGNGPTEVVAGSQYWTIDNEIDDGRWHPGDRVDRTIDESVFGGEDLDARDQAQADALAKGLAVPDLDRRFLHLRSGTVVLAHYDLFHRGSRTTGNPAPRYMVKFYFARVHEPTRTATISLPPTLPAAARPSTAPAVLAAYRWLTGSTPSVAAHPPTRQPSPAGTGSAPAARATPPRPSSPAERGSVSAGAGTASGGGDGGDGEDVERLRAWLVVGQEDERIEAAYRIGRAAADGDRAALATLVASLDAPAEGTRRAAARGLRQAGAAGVEPLLTALGSETASVRRHAIAALGTAAAAARSSDAVPAMLGALAVDPDDLVRSNAAYALGQLARAMPRDDDRTNWRIDAIVAGLVARLAPGTEPDNAVNVGLSRSTVRQSTAFALVQVLANHQVSGAQLAGIVDGLVDERDRYVQGLLVEALVRAGHLPPEVQRRLLDYLAGRRWSPSVDPVDAGVEAGAKTFQVR